jgi:predicted AlkP superfamily phosphohydrolase/phosphomutase
MDSMNKNSAKNRKMLAIGLDGATFDAIEPLMKEGDLPHLSRLVEEGASGRLASVFPPVTRPAWFCLSTGMTPDQTSLYDHTTVLGADYRLSQASHISYSGRSVWDILSRAGKKVHVLAYPWLYPVYPLNGIMVSGMGGVWEGQSVYPETFRKEIRSILGEDPSLVVRYHDRKYEDADLFLRDMSKSLSQKVRLAEYVIKQRQWDFLWLVFSESDWLQHRLWHAFDQKHVNFPGKENHQSHLFRKGWSEIDAALGKLLNLLDGDTDVLVVSDHGFGSNNHVFKINAWLKEKGYLKERSLARNRGEEVKIRIYKVLRRLGEKLHLARFNSLYEKGRKLAGTLGRDDAVGLIDLVNSQVFDPGHTNPTAILYINQNINRQCPEFVELKRSLEKDLSRLEEATGLQVKWRSPREGGKWLGDKVLVPDYILMMGGGGCVFNKTDMSGPLILNQPYSSRHTGSHREEGILIFRSHDGISQRLEGCSVADIVPTLLYAFQMPVPKRLPGRVIYELFPEGWRKDHPVIWVDTPDSNPLVGDKLMDSEEKAIKDQLKGLGYF